MRKASTVRLICQRLLWLCMCPHLLFCLSDHTGVTPPVARRELQSLLSSSQSVPRARAGLSGVQIPPNVCGPVVVSCRSCVTCAPCQRVSSKIETGSRPLRGTCSRPSRCRTAGTASRSTRPRLWALRPSAGQPLPSTRTPQSYSRGLSTSGAQVYTVHRTPCPLVGPKMSGVVRLKLGAAGAASFVHFNMCSKMFRCPQLCGLDMVALLYMRLQRLRGPAVGESKLERVLFSDTEVCSTDVSDRFSRRGRRKRLKRK